MDAFVVRKRRSPQEQLFEKNAFLFFPSAAALADSQEFKQLKQLVATNGGRLLATDAGEGTDGAARVIVVLHQRIEELQSRDIEMITRVVRRGAAAPLVVRSQWVRDCIHQQQRLATYSYDQTRAVLALAATSETGDHPLTGDQQSITASESVSGEESSKKRKIEMTASSLPQATVVSGELPRPHLTPWKEVNYGSLLILDARTKEQQEMTASNATRKIKIAGFDMDGTWIETKSGKRFAVDVNDWKWFHPTLARTKLEKLVREGYEIVLFSNQNGIAKGNVTAKEIEVRDHLSDLCLSSVCYCQANVT